MEILDGVEHRNLVAQKRPSKKGKLLPTHAQSGRLRDKNGELMCMCIFSTGSLFNFTDTTSLHISCSDSLPHLEKLAYPNQKVVNNNQ